MMTPNSLAKDEKTRPLAFSTDVFKKKATIYLNVLDIYLDTRLCDILVKD